MYILARLVTLYQSLILSKAGRYLIRVNTSQRRIELTPVISHVIHVCYGG